MRIVASQEAGTFVRERGGFLHVWYEPVGRGGWGRLLVSTDPPRGPVALETFDAGGFSLLLDTELPRPDELRVELRRRPTKRLRVRGFAVGGDGSGGEFVMWGTAPTEAEPVEAGTAVAVSAPVRSCL